MPSDSKFTRDDDGNVAVRVVSNTGVSEQPESMFTTDEDGNVAVRVVFGEGGGGGGGSDQHNLGWYATQAALEEAHPTAEAGDWAIVGATDTVWIWDTDNSAWVDSDQKGQVTSVNNQTGAVTITGDDILPSQSNNSGKFLTTNGTTASWGNALTNKTTALGAVVIAPGNVGNISVGNYGVCVGNDTKTVGECGVSVGYSAGRLNSNSKYAVCIGYNNAATAIGAYQFGSGTNSEAGTVCFALNTDGNNANWHNYKVLDSDGTIPADRLVNSINKYSTMPTAASTNEGWIVQFTGTTDSTYTHGRLYECVSDGGNPATYSWTEVSMGGSSLPSQTGNAGKFLTTDGTDASWGDALVNKATGTNSLSIGNTSSAHGNNIILGYNITLGYNPDNTVIGSNAICQPSGAVCIGSNASVNGSFFRSVAIGYSAETDGGLCVAIGSEARTYTAGSGKNRSIALGSKAEVGDSSHTTVTCAMQFGQGKNLESGTVCFGLSADNGSTWTNYKVLDSDGTIPTDRLTKVNSTVTLAAADWSSNTQTVNVTGMTATGVVMVSPDPTDQSAYTSAGILCTAQAAGTLTFTCDTVPSGDIDVNVVML